MLPTNQRLQWYLAIEQQLKSFFRLFDDLCAYCFEQSVEAVKAGRKIKPDRLCCCLADDQVRDYWICLDPIQTKMTGKGWRNKLPTDPSLQGIRADKGPCPALTCHGCAIKTYRPPTCSTQLCPYMLAVLHRLGIIPSSDPLPQQIEDLLQIASPLDILYGIRHGNISEESIRSYQTKLAEFTARLKAIPSDQRAKAIAEAKATLDQLPEQKRK